MTTTSAPQPAAPQPSAPMGDTSSDQTADVPPPPLPPPTAPPQRPTWRRTPVARDREHGRIGGVLAGISRSFGFDLRTTRIAVAIGTIVLPIIVVLYGVAWILLPKQWNEAQPLEDVVKDRRRRPLLIGIAIVVLAGGLGSFRSWFLFGGIPWGLGLIAVGALLWAAPGIWDGRDERAATSASPFAAPPVPGAPFAAPMPAMNTTIVDAGAPAPWGTDAAAGSAPSSTPSSAHSRRSATRRRRAPLDAIGVVATVAFVATGAAGDALSWWNLPILWGAVVAIAILWTFHALSGLVNRRWSVIPGLVLLGVVGTFLSVAQPHLDGGIGHHSVRPTTAAAASGSYELGVGQLTVDLTGIADLPARMTTSATVGVGKLQILVPADVTLEIDSHLGAGHVVVDGHEITNGVDQDDVRIDTATTSTSAGTSTTAAAAADVIVLDVEVGVGEITIVRLP